MTTARLVVALALCVGIAPVGSAEGQSPAEVEKEIEAVVARLRAAILARDVEGVLSFVFAEGMPCTDSMISKDTFRRDLRDGGSYLYSRLFDSSMLKSKYSSVGHSRSLLDFFRENNAAKAVISFQSYPGKAPYAFPCANFSEGEDLPLSFCFFKRRGRWWLTDSLYECG